MTTEPCADTGRVLREALNHLSRAGNHAHLKTCRVLMPTDGANCSCGLEKLRTDLRALIDGSPDASD